MGKQDHPARPAPRFELWNLELPAHVRTLQFVQMGVQAASPRVAMDAAAELQDLLAVEPKPDEQCRGLFLDETGATNVTWIAYWFDPVSYKRWADQPAVRSFWAGRPSSGPVGYWRESAHVPAEYIDTLYTTHDPGKFDQTGMARHGKMVVCAQHDYWGAVRDRLPALGDEDLKPDRSAYRPTRAPTQGKRVSVTAPANVCMARHHEDWRNSPQFGHIYLSEVAGVKEAGTRHLAEHPELGCITSRAIEGQSPEGSPIGRADAVAWFLSLDDLLSWARSDPSHLAIYGAFFKAATAVKEGQTWDVPMWHEVFVVPKGGLKAEYINCHNRTGFLTLLDDLVPAGLVTGHA
ncbi:aldoxime dehydratase [Panacagrimonas perspica]|uniref:Aldoxime dehydratase n=1 Tax=Panacagrimonas perspica TaxID=381431 RepID=A0A4R7NZN2_9GAMM|nr:phenylacetaldoxime dehydratase family protein [Panacagrimonas perspica]TDU26379.1 aldoxime dehydratase [Panacagrimonas perspica]THD02017.1 hypothetical protein B1810_16085 [Panacagrimonas perspica]